MGQSNFHWPVSDMSNPGCSAHAMASANSDTITTNWVLSHRQNTSTSPGNHCGMRPVLRSASHVAADPAMKELGLRGKDDSSSCPGDGMTSAWRCIVASNAMVTPECGRHSHPLCVTRTYLKSNICKITPTRHTPRWCIALHARTTSQNSSRDHRF